jgi:hypothetical protein
MNQENTIERESNCDTECNEDFLYCVEHGNFSCMDQYRDCSTICTTELSTRASCDELADDTSKPCRSDPLMGVAFLF